MPYADGKVPGEREEEDGEMFPEEAEGMGWMSQEGRVMVGRAREGTGHPFSKAGVKGNRAATQGM